jgi:hypothetical protein
MLRGIHYNLKGINPTPRSVHVNYAVCAPCVNNKYL